MATAHQISPRKATTNGDLRAVLQRATKRGWQLTRTSRDHVRLTQNGHIVGTGCTPSDARAVKNFESQVRRCERGECECRGEVEPIMGVEKKPTPAERSVSTMTSTETAKFFGLSPAWVSLQIQNKKLEPLEPPTRGQMTRITLESIERLEAERAKQGKPRMIVKKIEQPAPEPPVVEQVHEPEPPAPEPEAVAPAPEPPAAPPAEKPREIERDDLLLKVTLAKLEGYAMGKDDDTLGALILELERALGQ